MAFTRVNSGARFEVKRKVRADKSGELAAQTAHVAMRTSPEAEVGLFRLHFEQVHRIAVMHAILMGRNRATFDNELILRIQEIAI